MIYICIGNDISKKGAHITSLICDRENIFLPDTASAPLIGRYTDTMNLFGAEQSVVIENFLANNEIDKNFLDTLAASNTFFIFNEDKMLAATEKKYAKFSSHIDRFEIKEIKEAPRYNTFAITDYFERGDKIGAWTQYLIAVENNTAPEAISGLLFWKIKSMLLSGSKIFSPEKLKKLSSELVTIYHRSHAGEIDMTLALEQFILASLSS